MPAPTKNNFAAIIEQRASGPQDHVCFLDSSTKEVVTYNQLRLRSAWLARELEAQKVERGGMCAVDMSNCPALMYAICAAAYGGFSLVMLNARLTEAEKQDRLAELKRATKTRYIPVLDEQTTNALIAESEKAGTGARNQISQWARHGVGAFDELTCAVVMFTSGTSGRPKAAALTWEQLLGSARASNAALNTEGEGIWQLALPAYHVGGLSIVFRSVLNRNAFILYRNFDAEDILTDAYTYGATHISVVDKMLQDLLEHNVPDEPEVVAAAPDTDGAAAPDAGDGSDGTAAPDAGDAAATTTPAAEPTPAGDGAATATPAAESTPAAISAAPTTASPSDASAEGNGAAPIISLPSDAPAEANKKAPLSSYECILLGGSRPNQTTLARALDAGAKVYASYGMTETCSQVANTLVDNVESILLSPLPGYELTVAAPGEDGFGQLAVRGPGVIDGYLNARAAFTADGYFLTGDRARMVDGRVEVSERASDMFVSGGENVYPAEIRDKILAIEGVTDAHVFGAAHESWGRRPVAFVEAQAAASRPGYNRFYFADEMRNRLSMVLSPLYLPDQFVLVDEFPRTSMGKTGVGTLERAWQRRIHVAKVDIWQVRLPLVSPIRTPRHKLRERDALIVRITDLEGRTGIGECVSFATNWYMEETIQRDLPLLRDALAPLLVGRVLLHPNQVTELFENIPGSADCPLACAALEMAVWDLYGKIRQRSIRQLIGAREAASEPGSIIEVPTGCVLGGAVVGVGSPNEVLDAVNKAVEDGYRRVKIKVSPGNDVKVLEAVRAAHPRLMLMLDANQSYKDSQIDLLKALDEFNIECIEEPLDPAFTPAVGPKNIFDRLARLQSNLRMRVCLDESWTTGDDLRDVLEAHPELRCVALKIAKFGGLGKALDFYAWARERGIEVWPGGMFDTGISKRLHAAFGLLNGVNLPGDISSSARYFTVDICNPPLVVEDGVLQVNAPDYPYGLGCVLNEEALASVQVGHWTC